MNFLGLNISTSRGLQRTLASAVSKSVSQLAAAWMRGDDVDASGARLTSAYQQSTWVYACVSAIAQQVAQIPFRFSRTSRVPMKERCGAWRRKAIGETIVESGPMVELFARPHPQLNRYQFWELLVSWLQLRGEFFAVPMDNSGAHGVTRPTVLVVLSPDSFREEVRANMLVGWRYTGSGQQSPAPTMDLLPADVITDRLANPFDFWRGMSPLMVARLAAQSDYASAQFEKGLMLNNADTGVIVTTDQQVDEPQREAILSALRERKRKAGTADRPLFLWGGAKIDKPTISSADMQFLENRKFKRQEICAVFRVPQEIIGFTEDANRAVSESARLNWIENSISPTCERIEAALDPFIKRQDSSLWGWFDIEALPIMASARRARYAGAVQAFGMGVPIDDCSEIFDLGLPDDLPHAGKSYLPFSLQEVGTETTPGTEAPPAAEPAQSVFERAGTLVEALKRDALKRETHICAPNPEYEASIAGSVRIKRSKLNRFFFEQRGRVLAALQEEISLSNEADGEPPSAARGPRALPTELKAIDDLFNSASENAELMKKLKPLLIADLEFGGAQLWKEVGLSDFKLPPTDALKFLGKRESMIKGINETTWGKLKDSLGEGLTNGETFDELSDRVKEVYSQAEGRADTIAFTETNVAVNSGRHQAMKQARVQRKGWQTSHLENTRATHIANESFSKEQGGIPIDTRWPNGLAYPGDPDGDPGETINCRCFGYAVLEKRAASPLLRFEEWARVNGGADNLNHFAMGPGRFAKAPDAQEGETL